MSEPTIEAEILECPVCRCPMFTRANGLIVGHYAGTGLGCSANEQPLKDYIGAAVPPKDKLTAKTAPESEDEAFERAWQQQRGRADVPLHYKAWFEVGWNARARLDAERGR